MRFSLDAGTEVGYRAARILLSDARCEGLELFNPGWDPSDSRATQTRNVIHTDVVISDGTTPLHDLIGRASVAGVPLVSWPDVADSDLGPASIPVVVGANLGSTLADALLEHPASEPTEDDSVKVAWTEPGRAHRSGTPFAFPEPIGMAWTEERSPGRFVAHRDDEWAGASTIVEGPAGQRVVGVADHGPHLEALTLVTVAMVAARGSFDPGIQSSRSALADILAEARNMELDVAVWRSHS